MSPRRVLAILAKDLRDALRDGRIVVLLLLPIGLAVFAGMANSETPPATSVIVAGPATGAVAHALSTVARGSVRIQTKRVADAPAARSLVAAGEADVAIVAAPRAEVLVAADASPAAETVVALAPEALTRAAGQPPAARVPIRSVAAADPKPVDVIGPRVLTVLVSILLLAAFVAMMVVPIQTAEEIQTGTFGALRLAATAPEILAAKALSGYVYGAAGVGATVALTRLDIHDPFAFFGAALALVVSLVGFGLLLGLLLPNPNAINTYAGFLVGPLVLLGAAVFSVDTGILATILDVLPFSQAAKLLGDGVSRATPFDAGPVAWLVIGVWTVVGYGLLARIAARREL